MNCNPLASMSAVADRGTSRVRRASLHDITGDTTSPPARQRQAEVPLVSNSEDNGNIYFASEEVRGISPGFSSSLGTQRGLDASELNLQAKAT
jgi:hypothetical protein